MNARRTMYKLQTALCAKGKLVRINQKQHWNEIQQKMVTKYQVLFDGWYEPMFESYKAPEVVQYLAGLLTGGDVK